MLQFFDLRYHGISQPTDILKTSAKVFPDGTGILTTWRQPRKVLQTGWDPQSRTHIERRILLATSHLQSAQVSEDIKHSFLQKKQFVTTSNNPQASAINVARSIRRTRSKIRDIIRSNDFDLFVTFTFGQNRHDAEACFARLHAWLNSQQHRHGKFRYLIVPERHKDGAIHFHALFGDFTGAQKYSGVMQRGKKVYNLTGWRHGYTNATKIKNKKHVASYCKKYITKELYDLPYKKRYWCSQNLQKPLVIPNIWQDKRYKIVAIDDVVYTTECFQIQNIIVDLNSQQLRTQQLRESDIHKKWQMEQKHHATLTKSWNQLTLFPEPAKRESLTNV